ncbi:NicO-domain-containing protein [Ganoderma leucocontextum]|nr:NicO-domain-containing protein [Ganoderma leucocontextum]
MPWRPGKTVSLPRLHLFGRSAILLATELLVNVICWTVPAVLFGRMPGTRPILSLALLAWVTLDADHISAIDNATRNLINMGQLPVTCGLFFSLGHSTIVIAVNVAIAISTDVYDRMQTVGQVGGIIGAAVSASFLFVVGLANSIILYRILRKRRQIKKRRAEQYTHSNATVEEDPEEADGSHQNTLMMKLIGPVVTSVDRPWKMYPVGVLFGFGFDTASSIALLAISAIAKRDPDGGQISPGDVIVLPLLFTYSYAGFLERSFAIFERPSGHVSSARPRDPPQAVPQPGRPSAVENAATVDPEEGRFEPESEPAKTSASNASEVVAVAGEDRDDVPEYRRTMHAKRSAMSNLSIILTTMSIVVAFSISLITMMGLIGEQCTACQNAANAPDGGGLAGRWWRGWASANDNSGYIGAAIVGSFVFVVSSWYGCRFLYRKWHARRNWDAAQAE